MTFTLFIKNCFSFLKRHLLLLCGLFSTLPFLVVSIYNNPYADDYCYSDKTNLLGFWDAQKYYYFNWSGRYTATAILSNDIVNDKYSIYYTLFPVLLILGLIFSFYFLISQFVEKKEIYLKAKLSFILFLLYISQMPLLSEGFYWWAGAMTYQLANIFTVFFIGIIIKSLKKNSLTNTISGIFVLIILVGLNETSLIAINLLLASIVFYNYIFLKKKNVNLVSLLVVLIIFSMASILAPGNYVRMDRNDNAANLIFSSALSIGQYLWSLLTWSGPPFLFSIIIYNEIKDYLKSNTIKLIETKKGYIFLTFSVIITSCFFLGFWSQGEAIPPRARNVVYLFFMLGVIYISINYFINNINITSFFKKGKQLMLLITFSVLSIAFSNDNFVETVKDVGKKRAYKFDKEMQERLIYTKENQHKEELVFPELKNKPYSLFCKDFDYDSKNVFNTCYSKYWDLKSVIRSNKN